MTTSILTDDVNVSFFSLKGVMTRNNEDLSVLLAIGDNWQCYSGKKKELTRNLQEGGLICCKKKKIWPLHQNRRVIRYQNYPFQSPHLPKTSFFFSYTFLTARKGQWRIFRKRAISTKARKHLLCWHFHWLHSLWNLYEQCTTQEQSLCLLTQTCYYAKYWRFLWNWSQGIKWLSERTL